VDLQEIDVRGLETSERRVDSVEDCSTRQARLVNVLGQLTETGHEECREGRITCDKAIALGGDYDLGARNVVLWWSYIRIWSINGIRRAHTFLMNLATMRSDSPFE